MIGFGLALIMGVVLGLLGGGGSILTVPILVYFFKINATLATSYSLFVVGITSLIGAIRYKKQLNVTVALFFAIPSTIGVLLTRTYILAPMPDIINFYNYSISKDSFIMSFFAVLIFIISFFMLKAKDNDITPHKQNMTVKHQFLIVLEGLLVGSITGFVGAGGGFMIVPALTLLVGIPLRNAIATSLLIIAAKSLIGFLGDISLAMNINWMFILSFSFITILGSLIGTKINAMVPVAKLRKLFAYFVIFVGIGILVMQ